MNHPGYVFRDGLIRMPLATLSAAIDRVLAEDNNRELLVNHSLLAAEVELRMQPLRCVDEDGATLLIIAYKGDVWDVCSGKELLDFLVLAGYAERLTMRVRKVLFARFVRDARACWSRRGLDEATA